MLLKRLIVISVVLGVLILLASGFLWFQTIVPEQRTFLLSNGSVITFRQATFGTNHTFSPAGPWRKFVPRFLSRWLKTPNASSTFSTTPAVMLWFEQRGAASGSQNYTCSIVHPDGTETAFESGRSYASLTPTNSVEGLSSAYPQREKILRFRFYEQKNYDELIPIGEFTVRNPHVSRIPRKSAPPLPQTSRDGDLEVTLVSLESGGPRSRWEKTNVMHLWTKAMFRVLERGEPSTNWTVQRMEATDSTGQNLVSRSWTGMTEKKLEKFECQPELWPSETYSLRFEFSRKAEAVFETNELWTIRNVAVPTNGEFNLVNTQMNLGRFNVRFRGVTTPGAHAPWQEMMGGSQSLGFSVSPEPKDFRFTLVSVTDDAGSKVESSGAGYSNTNWGFGLRLKDTSKSLDVTVAIHRSRFVAFEAQPVWSGNQVR